MGGDEKRMRGPIDPFLPYSSPFAQPFSFHCNTAADKWKRLLVNSGRFIGTGRNDPSESRKLESRQFVAKMHQTASWISKFSQKFEQ